MSCMCLIVLVFLPVWLEGNEKLSVRQTGLQQRKGCIWAMVENGESLGLEKGGIWAMVGNGE